LTDLFFVHLCVVLTVCSFVVLQPVVMEKKFFLIPPGHLSVYVFMMTTYAYSFIEAQLWLECYHLPASK